MIGLLCLSKSTAYLWSARQLVAFKCHVHGVSLERQAAEAFGAIRFASAVPFGSVLVNHRVFFLSPRRIFGAPGGVSREREAVLRFARAFKVPFLGRAVRSLEICAMEFSLNGVEIQSLGVNYAR